jgi:hypothetical protein
MYEYQSIPADYVRIHFFVSKQQTCASILQQLQPTKRADDQQKTYKSLTVMLVDRI